MSGTTDTLIELRDLNISGLVGYDPSRRDTLGTLEHSLLSAQQLAVTTLAAGTSLQQQLVETEARYQEAQGNVVASQSAIDQLHATNSRHEATIDRLLTHGPTGVRERSQKIPDPDKFNGDRAKYRNFVSKLRLKLMSDANSFPTEVHKLAYAFSLLEGAAYDQVRAYITTDEDGNDRFDLANIAALFRILESAFDDPDRARNAMRKIKEIKQGKRDFSTYVADFMRYAPDVELNTPSKIDYLRSGLSEEILRHLISVVEPETWDGFTSLCLRIDNKVRMHQAEMKSRNPSGTTQVSSYSRTTTTTPAATPTTSTATGTQSGPMDLSGIRGPLSTQEKARRMAEGLCLYCGGLGHMARDCPIKARPRMRGAATGPAPAPAPEPAPPVPAAPAQPAGNV